MNIPDSKPLRVQAKEGKGSATSTSASQALSLVFLLAKKRERHADPGQHSMNPMVVSTGINQPGSGSLESLPRHVSRLVVCLGGTD